MPRSSTRALLLLAFFLSGLSTLIYELVWIKHLVYLFGVTYHAITTVVTVFMAGLAFGALGAGRWVDRSPRPLRIYAILELVIAACGLLFPLALGVTSALYHSVHDGMQLGFFGHTLVRFLLACGLLLIPTIAMGATLPALARYFVLSGDRVGRDMGRLYGMNTVGAAIGCVLTGFVLLYNLGLTWTNTIAVGLNIAAAAVAWAMLWREGGAAPRPAEAPTDRGPPSSRWLLAAFALSGFTAVAYELLWTRIVALLHPNAHTLVFALVLGLYLVGTGLGSAAYGRWLARRDPLTLYAAVQLLVGLLAVLSPFAFVLLREGIGWAWYDAWEPARTVMDLYLSLPEFLLIVAVVGLPSLLFGLTFPLGNRLYVRRFAVLGSGVGAVYFFATVGGILGSFATGFLLMPLVGAKGCLFLLAALNLGLGAALFASRRGWPRGRRIAAAGAGLAAMVGVLVVGATALPASVFINVPTDHEVVFYKDGRSTTDAVVWVEQRDERYKMLFANGEFVSAGAVGVWLPIFLHPEPERVLILAFDTGASSGMAVQDPAVRSVEAADISDVQEEIAAHFEHLNMGVIRDPRFRLVANDGRNHLATSREDYDVIFNGVAAYSGYLELSTQEFFEICRSRLQPGGVFAHKIHPHMLTPEGLERVVATFLEVFPDATLWRARVSSVLLLVGTNDAPKTAWGELDASRLGPYGIDENLTPVHAASLFLTDAEGLAAVAGDGAVLVDDRPPRLSDMLTLIDTGSDFIARGPVQMNYKNFEREINGILVQHERSPERFFDDIPAPELVRILTHRQLDAPPGYRREPEQRGGEPERHPGQPRLEQR